MAKIIWDIQSKEVKGEAITLLLAYDRNYQLTINNLAVSKAIRLTPSQAIAQSTAVVIICLIKGRFKGNWLDSAALNHSKYSTLPAGPVIGDVVRP